MRIGIKFGVKNSSSAYNVEEDCNDYTRKGLTHVYAASNKIMVYDYSTYFNPAFRQTFIFEFMYEGPVAYGYCGG